MDEKNFSLSKNGLSESQRKTALEEFKKYISEQKSNFLGFQANQKMDYKSDTADFLDCSINNLGDPFKGGSFTVNSKVIEKSVLRYYADLWNLTHAGSADAWWGYVSSAGCTEANIYGLWNGRDYLAGKFEMYPTSEDAKRASLAPVQTKIPYEPRIRRVSKAYRKIDENINRFSPILFCSESTHYSVKKAADVLRIKTFTKIGEDKFPNECPLPDAAGHWPENVPCNNDGSINIDALTILVEFFAEKNYPILINFNYGTTFSGAYDNVEAAGKKLIPIFKKYGLFKREVPNPLNQDKSETRTGFWFHVDGALGAAYMPFIQMAYENGLIDKTGPKFDFQLDYVHSISMSGHKWIGTPFPCGIYMTKKKYLLPHDSPEYIASPDSTFAGSRNGLSAVILWNYLARNSYDKQIKKALLTQRIADYAERKLKNLQKDLQNDLWVERADLSLAVRFRQVSDALINKYSLSGKKVYVKGKLRAYNHLYAMEHVTEELIDQFIKDLEHPDAFPAQEESE